MTNKSEMLEKVDRLYEILRNRHYVPELGPQYSIARAIELKVAINIAITEHWPDENIKDEQS